MSISNNTETAAAASTAELPPIGETIVNLVRAGAVAHVLTVAGYTDKLKLASGAKALTELPAGDVVVLLLSERLPLEMNGMRLVPVSAGEGR